MMVNGTAVTRPFRNNFLTCTFERASAKFRVKSPSTHVSSYARFPPFRCRSSVAVSPFCRYKIPLFCKNYVRKFRSVTAVNSKKIRNGSGKGNGNGVQKRQRLTETAEGNGRTATKWWKPGIMRHVSGVTGFSHSYYDVNRCKH